MNQEQLTNYLIAKGADWIRSQKAVYSGVAQPISPNAKSRLSSFFTDEILEKSKFAQVPRLENPPFYSELANYGIEIPLDFSEMLGITFDDTVVFAQSLLQGVDLPRLMFHELVHVVQYQFLGVDEFMKEYVNGWASNGFDYNSIPLEVEAYTLDEAYSKRTQFSVYDALQAKYKAV